MSDMPLSHIAHLSNSPQRWPTLTQVIIETIQISSKIRGNGQKFYFFRVWLSDELFAIFVA